MKKFILLLVLGVMLLLPLSAKAFQYDEDNSKCETLECGNGDAECVSVCTVAIKGNVGVGLTSVSLKITPKTGVTITEIIPTDQWTFSGTYSDAVFTAVDQDLGVLDESFILFTFKQTYSKSVPDCSPEIRFTDGSTVIIPVPTPDPVPECEDGDPNCSNTGVSLPVVVLAGGAVLAIALYSLTNKNKKMYKI